MFAAELQPKELRSVYLLHVQYGGDKVTELAVSVQWAGGVCFVHGLIAASCQPEQRACSAGNKQRGAIHHPHGPGSGD